MPYTPPSHRSPASSTPTSPDVSRRPSFHHSPTGNSRPTLPRSASYLTRHRRTPSAPSSLPGRATEPTPESTSEDLKGMIISTSVRQSPPPVTGDCGIPNGAVISPPESSSDDDDLPEIRKEARGRQIENLRELHEAISQIPQHRSSSPTKTRASTVDGAQDTSDVPVVPSQAGTIFEVDSEEEAQRKPQMVRKKSGELVRPALRASSRRRPSSMPGTPTFSKAVHFDSHLEHVRHFLQVDRPLAVSAGSSPVDSYDSDTEYPFAEDCPATRPPPFEWELHISNFPAETPARKLQPVWLERVWLSLDQKSLIGSVVVANLAFQKYVTCRFTLDYWKTTSEVGAEYVKEVTPRQGPIGSDRFHFTIKLSDMANLESKTLYFCIRYNVTGQEHWDNNSGMNFQVDFHKKPVPQNGKKGVIGAANRPANGLPKSTRRQNPSTAPRPTSMPIGANDFGDSQKLSLAQSLDEYLGDALPKGLRLKGVKSTTSIPSDNLASRLPAPSGQAFANRYDFGASLTAAIQTAKDSLSGKSDGLYMKSFKKSQTANANTSGDNKARSSTTSSSQTAAASKPATGSGADSPGASISSSSYEELVNKYCFFGSKQPVPGPRDDAPPRNGQFDGPGELTRSGSSSHNSSYDGSPVQMSNYYHAHNGTQHHSLHPKDPTSYFHHGSPFVTMYASPSQSPLEAFSPQIPGNSLASRQANDHSSSPTAASSFAPYAGTLPNEFTYQPPHHNRFPFSGHETHSATAIRG